MKWLEQDELNLLNAILSECEIGDRIINGRLDAFSCKRAGTDKKLAKSLEQVFQSEIASSLNTLSSPLGSLANSSTRRLLIDLISTMNASWPDYEFSSLRPERFTKEPNFEIVRASINTRLAEMVECCGFEGGRGFLQQLWTAVEQAIEPRACEVYSYVPEFGADPFTEGGTLWSFNFFFVNKSMKKILYFTCMSRSKFSCEHDDELEDMDVQDDDCSTNDSIEWDDDI